MKLSPEQIDRLYDFTRQHYVEYYDLQTELVDHLANAIEEQWVENPNVSFETALDIEFKKFGVFGFTDLVSQRRKVLTKKYYSIILFYFKDFFKFPKVLATIASVFIVYQILSRFEISENDFNTLLYSLMGFSFVIMFASGWKRKRKLVKFEKIWLFEEIISNAAYINLAVVYILHFALDILSKIFTEIYTYSILVSMIAVLYVIFIYIIQFVIPSKAQEYLKQTYPEYEFSK